MAELEQVSAPLKFIKQKEQIAQDALSELVDLYCKTDAEIAPAREALKIQEKQLEEVEKELQAHLDEANQPHENGVLKTQEWLLQFAAKGKATEVLDKEAIFSLLGKDLFLNIVTVSITELKKYLTENQLKQLTKEVNKHKRKLKYAPVEVK